MAPSRESVVKTMFAALKILKAHGGEMRRGDIVAEIKQTVELSEWEREIPPTSKYNTPRWIIFFDAVSGSYCHTGLIVKKAGVWYLTKEGEKALSRNPEELYNEAREAYRKYMKEYKTTQSVDVQGEMSEDEEEESIYSIDKLIEYSNGQIKDYIQSVSPYEFQDMVAALLRAMGYYTPFIAPKGRDGGVDIVAYQDSLGTKPPRIKVQVKQYQKENKISVDIIRALAGQLKQGMDVGIIVTTSDFTTDAQIEARQGDKSIRLIDGEEFIQLWLHYYDRMNAEDRNRMPLMPVYMLNI